MINFVNLLVGLLIGTFIVGSIYSLIAVGLSMLLSTVGLLNFAHGALLAVGAYASWYFTLKTGSPALMLIGFPILFLLGITSDKLFFKKIRYKPNSTGRLMLLTTTLAVVIEQILNITFGGVRRKIPTIIKGGISMGDIVINNNHILISAIAIFTIILLYFILTRTVTGIAIRAVGQNIEESLIVGVNVELIYTITVGIGFALAGLAGTLLGSMYIFNAAFGRHPLFIGYIIVVLGGLGNIKGTLYASFMVAIIEQLSYLILGGSWGIAAPFLSMVIILIIRPYGLFGLKEEVR